MEKRKRGGCLGWCVFFIVLSGIIIAAFVYFKHKFLMNDDGAVPDHRGAITQKYADALKIAMQFFDIQKSGKLENNPISWRGDSGLRDGIEAKLDLSKGMYDAGDHVKFGFPMAFTATILSWAILEYGDQMESVDQLQPAQVSLRWITGFLLNAHPSDNVLYIQVGDPKIDHGCWNRPEDMKEKRPLIQVNVSSPGADVAAETAAALASSSLVFKASDPSYSTLLLKHAKQLFSFANKYRESYSVTIPQVRSYYNSTGYGDELLWAASWLLHATGEESYYEFVTGTDGEEYGDWGNPNPSWFSWDNKLAGAQVLLSRITFFGSKKDSPELNNYRKSAEALMCSLLPESPSASLSRTEGGLIWVTEWNALQHSVSSAFLATVYSDYMLTSRTRTLNCDGSEFQAYDLRYFARSQIDYVIGQNDMKMSFLVGYGDNYPEYVHHRGASIPADESPGCKEGFKWLDSDDPNPNIATGALVGGPFLNETYIDSRNNSMQGEPTTYNSALIVGLLSGLVTTSSVVTSFR